MFQTYVLNSFQLAEASLGWVGGLLFSLWVTLFWFILLSSAALSVAILCDFLALILQAWEK